MPKYIEKLTLAQEARFEEWRDKWIAVGLKTGDADFETFEKFIPVAYHKAGLKFPNKIIRVASPIVGAFAASIANNILNETKNSCAVDVAVRDAVDDAVCVAVGDAVHDAVDDAVCDAVGDAVGGAVRGAVHDAVDVAVHDAVDVAVRGAVRGAVDFAVDVAVHDAVHGAVDGAVRGAVRGAVDGAVGVAVRGAVHDAVEDAVGVAVRGAVGVAVGGLNWHYWLGGQFWVGGRSGSPAYVSFFTDVCGLELEPDIAERAECYRKLCESVNYMWLNSQFVMVCDRPAKIFRDAEGRLHNEYGKAIEYKDGWGLYYLDGIRFEKDLWAKIVKKELSFAELMQIENADQQAVALKHNAEAIIKENAELVDKSERGNELFKITGQPINDLLDEPEIWFLRMQCPTGRTFVEGVEPALARKSLKSFQPADYCQAAALGLNLDQYSRLRMEG